MFARFALWFGLASPRSEGLLASALSAFDKVLADLATAVEDIQDDIEDSKSREFGFIRQADNEVAVQDGLWKSFDRAQSVHDKIAELLK